MAVDYLLYESAAGYAVFSVVHQPDAVGNRMKEVQDSVQDLSKFGKMVKLISFAPFQGAAQALENANDISEGIASEYLVSLLEINLPKSSKNSKITLGVSDKTLAGSIKAAFPGIECQTGDTSETVQDMLRGLRQHAHKLLKQLQDGDEERAQLGLGHAYSRAKVKFSVQKNDNHIIQAIATLDHLDKAINTFSMRVREWYSWHFPELIRIVSENHQYAKVALFVGDKRRLSDKDLPELAVVCNNDTDIARSVIDAAKMSMGQDISDADMENVTTFASKVVKLVQYRKTLHTYLVDKMGVVAPNLATLIGEVVGARLISHAGSLTNLSKYPASTVQILGAEKALFRALKTKGNTPKYGLIYHSSFIGKAGPKNKGRISRFLANKCSIASRIDNFSEAPTTVFGSALRSQVEERLRFYESGEAPSKNADVMKKAMDDVLADVNIPTGKADGGDVEMADVAPRAVQKQEKQQKDKSEKKKIKEEKRPEKEEKKRKKRKHEESNEAMLAEETSNGKEQALLVDGAGAEESKKEKKEKKKEKRKDRDGDGTSKKHKKIKSEA